MARTATIGTEQVDHVQSFLEELEEKTPETLTFRQAVDQLKVPLEKALAKGYTYPELAGMLTDKGMSISPTTLKNYVSAGRKQVEHNRKVRKPRGKGKVTEDMTVDATEQVIPPTAEPSTVEPEMEPAPRQGRAPSKKTPTRTPGKMPSSATKETTKTGGRGRGRAKK